MNMLKSAPHLLALVAAATTIVACGSPSETSSDGEKVASSAAALTYGGPDLMWQNTSTGEIGAWVLNGTTVTGTQDLTWKCGSSDGCSTTWNPVDTQGSTILWDNPTSGDLQNWDFDSNGNVSTEPKLSWQCSAASGCSASWRPIGRIQTYPFQTGGVPILGTNESLVWHNASTGEVSTWEFFGSNVSQARAIDWTCDSNCAASWRAVLTADFDGDGNTDILWQNTTTGQLSSWLLYERTATNIGVKGTQNLSWTCTAASGCATSWHIVGAADVNGDGHIDLTWHNPTSGKVSSWLLDGAGNVSTTADLNWTCDSASGCSTVWRAIGYVSFPQIPQPPPK